VEENVHFFVGLSVFTVKSGFAKNIEKLVAVQISEKYMSKVTFWNPNEPTHQLNSEFSNLYFSNNDKKLDSSNTDEKS
jgi:hypothetical protein